MSFRLVPKSVTLNDLERRNGPYFALFYRIWYSGAHCVKVVDKADAYALQTTVARYSRQRCRFRSGGCIYGVAFAASPVVSKDDLGHLAAVQLEVVFRGPFLHVGEFRVPRRLVAGRRDDDVRVVGVLAHRVSRHSGVEVLSGDWSNG